MYAIVNIKGEQFKVEKGRWITTPKLGIETDESVEFNQVLMYNDGNETFIGQPYLDNIKIQGKVLNNFRDKKVIVFKYKKRKHYRRKRGHRQHLSKVMIENIEQK